MPRKKGRDEDEADDIWSYAQSGNLSSVKTALRKGGEADMQNEVGLTAAHVAASADHVDVLKLLHGRGANFELRDHEGRTVAHEAARSGSLASLKYLNDVCHIDLSSLHGKGKTQEIRSYLRRVAGPGGAGRASQSQAAQQKEQKIWFRDDARNKKGSFQRKLAFSGAQKKKQLQEKRASKRDKAVESAAADAEEAERRGQTAEGGGHAESDDEQVNVVELTGGTGRLNSSLCRYNHTCL
jgi:ankyrin repeat protein